MSDSNVELARRGYTAALNGELVEVSEAGDRVLVIMRPRTDAGTPPRLTANITTFRDGRVVEMVHYANPDDARAALSPR